MSTQNQNHNQDVEFWLRSLIPQADKKFETGLEERLLTQLNTMDIEDVSASKRRLHFSLTPIWRVGLGVGLLILMFAIALIISPTVRAQVQVIIKKIGGITFLQTDQYPIDTPYPSWNMVDRDIDISEHPVLVSQQSMPIEEAQSIVPFGFVPNWLPQDTEFVNAVVNELAFSDGLPGWRVTLTWTRYSCQGCDRSNIYLEAVSPLAPDQELDIVNLNMVVGEGGVEEVTINTKTAALIRGYWFTPARNPLWPWPEPADVTPTPKWHNDGGALGLRLIWMENGVLYTLVADENYVSVDELISIAESIPSERIFSNEIPVLMTSQALSLEDIQDNLPYQFNLPDWMPDGFEFINANLYKSQLNSDESDWSVIILWQKNHKGVGTTISMIASAVGNVAKNGEDPSLSTYVGIDSVEEVDVNGIPAALISGLGWSNFDCYSCGLSRTRPTSTPQWSDYDSLTLMWIKDGLIYELLADDTYYVSRSDLIRIAESIP